MCSTGVTFQRLSPPAWQELMTANNLVFLSSKSVSFESSSFGEYVLCHLRTLLKTFINLQAQFLSHI